MIKKLPKIVIFDWDSTLAQTRKACVDSIEVILEKYNKEPWSVTKKAKRDYTKSYKENFANFFPENYKEAYQDYINYYISNKLETVTPTENAQQYLDFVVKNNIDIHIVSNKDSQLLKLEAKKCFPNVKFGKILGSDDIGRTKPNPDGLNLIKYLYPAVNYEDMWMVGDSTQDVEAAINAGITPVIVQNKETIEKLYKETPQILSKITLLNNFDELLKLHKELLD